MSITLPLLMIPSAQYEESLIKLSNAESEIEGLKLQIDDALGAEDLLVQLTERNLELGEVCAVQLLCVYPCTDADTLH